MIAQHRCDLLKMSDKETRGDEEIVLSDDDDLLQSTFELSTRDARY